MNVSSLLKIHSGKITVIGITLLCGLIDMWLIHEGYESISEGFWSLEKLPVGAALAGGWMGLTYHLLLQNIVENKRKQKWLVLASPNNG